MVTQAAALNWLGQQVGQHLDYDRQYGQQCFDFFNYYYQFLTDHDPYADGYGVEGAKDIWNVPSDFFDFIPDSDTLMPVGGDILIYGSAWGGGYGHVEVCRWSDVQGCHVVGENENNNQWEGVIEVYRRWSGMRGLVGVMRPHFLPDQQEPPSEPTQEPTPIPDPVPAAPGEPEAPPAPETPRPVTTPVEEPPQTTPVDPAPTIPPTPKPPIKVIIPNPSEYYGIWELVVAIFKKLIGKK